MKLSIRTLNQKVLSVDLEATRSVKELKEVLEKMPDVTLPADSLQLIYSGRILEDDKPLSAYNIDESRFIVLMGKKKLQVAQSENATPPSSMEKVPPTPPLSTAPSLAVTEQPTPSRMPNQQLVQDLMAMGYNELDVREALRASFNHPERAIEYLINGIPSQAAVETSVAPTTGADAASGPGNAANLAFLAADPRFEQVRDLIRQNPEMLGVVLTRLAEQDPEAFDAIRNHQQEFLNLLNDNVGDLSNIPTDSEFNLDVTLTAEETAAVDRLAGLGFPRDLVVQVYLACDKNEELTAEILCQSEDEIDEPL
ncbi:UV excision repair protein RAD23 homolog A-like isoform X1 [Scaptodrosophila lebanonensis]|uniref:UV excision repair protein RAD23 n=1 Tax=Drosophila lebanonensis TaxID=7225 RepID=A0A6J2T3Z7_DROLE|nr:UV excision repair protein RAD23 homolog A-like isoform X1 [Scaptodrosophila lebanonensis]